jgi:SAM-dependent methyltransferase
MATEAARAVGSALNDLFQRLGIERAHIAAARRRTDWHGLATLHPNRVGSLILVSPMAMDTTELQALGSRLLVLTGDQGAPAQIVRRLLTSLPHAISHTLRDYTSFPWSDVMADRSAEICPAMLDFLDFVGQRDPVATAKTSAEQQGEVAGIFYHIRGAGPPLVLMPLDLAPSQWEPLISLLSARYCTITLSGPTLGFVSVLEARGRSSYLSVVRALLDAVLIQPGETILEVGPGSGVVLRELARRTAGANRIIGVDINPYLLREATALAKREGLADTITLQEGSAEALPLAANSVDIALSCTVMEEGDADRMLGELVRVTRPGGRVAAIVRATDMPSWANLQLSTALRSKVDRPGLINAAGTAAGGCADASLYRRFHAAGLTELTFFPQHAAVTPTAEADRLASFVQGILGSLTPDDAAEWTDAVTQGEADGTFFIASSHHCAVGTKPT